MFLVLHEMCTQEYFEHSLQIALNMLQIVAMIDFCVSTYAKIRYIHNKFMGYLKCDLKHISFQFQNDVSYV